MDYSGLILLLSYTILLAFVSLNGSFTNLKQACHGINNSVVLNQFVKHKSKVLGGRYTEHNSQNNNHPRRRLSQFSNYDSLNDPQLSLKKTATSVLLTKHELPGGIFSFPRRIAFRMDSLLAFCPGKPGTVGKPQGSRVEKPRVEVLNVRNASL